MKKKTKTNTKELIIKSNKDLNVFPLSPTHRKELKQLKDNNIADLRKRFYTIKRLKSEEFKEKHTNKIKEIVEKNLKVCEELNKNYYDFLNSLYSLSKHYKDLEKENIGEFIRRQNLYNSDFLDLSNSTKEEFIKHFSNKNDKNKQIYYVNESYINTFIEKEFKRKFNKKFDNFLKYIDELEEKFKESVVFGDLLTCKDIYFKMKECDKKLDELNDLEV
jgi:hypothetical protein